MSGRPIARTVPMLAAAALAACAAGVSPAQEPSAATTSAQIRYDFVPAPDGVPLCTAEVGRAEAPTIVLLHGFSQSYAVFKRQLESDLGRDFRLIAFDLRGHGCSGKPWTEAAYRDSRIWAEDLRTVLEARRAEKPLLVGWSYGGFVLMDYVRHHGTQGLRGLVLVGSNAGLLPPPTDPALVERLARQREANRNASPSIEWKMTAGDQFVKLMTAKPLPPDMERIMFVANQMLPAYAQRAMASRSLLNEDVVAKLDAPVTLLLGGKDFTNSAETLGALAKKIPGARLIVYPESGHSPFIEEPERFNAELRALMGGK